MPMPNASWSGDARTAASSGVIENRSGPPSSSLSAWMTLAAAWL